MPRRQQLHRRDVLKWSGFLAGIAIISGILAGCGGSEEEDALSLEISCDGNNLTYDKATLTAPAGELVELNFHNVSTTFQHNWVLVEGGEAAAEQVNQAAIAAGADADFLPPDMPQILAHTKLTSTGESDTIRFTTPSDPGEYLYLCTFPGHYLAGMRGTFVVTS
jgi:azurin